MGFVEARTKKDALGLAAERWMLPAEKFEVVGLDKATSDDVWDAGTAEELEEMMTAKERLTRAHC